MGDFRKLRVWQRAKDLAVYVYKVSSQGKFAKDYGLKDQICRAAVSIPSNIAEGDELDTNKHSIKFFHIAKGSCAEVLTQAIIAHEISYLANDHFTHISEECRVILSMLAKLIQVRSEIRNPKP